MGLSQRFACKVVGQSRSTQRKELAKNTPDDPDVDRRKWLRDWAKANARKGFRRAWADTTGAGIHRWRTDLRMSTLPAVFTPTPPLET